MIPATIIRIRPFILTPSDLSRPARVAHTVSFMYAPHDHAQHPCHRVLSVACPGLLRVADIKGDVGATRVFFALRGRKGHRLSF
jgi:hypothetical protein